VDITTVVDVVITVVEATMVIIVIIVVVVAIAITVVEAAIVIMVVDFNSHSNKKPKLFGMAKLQLMFCHFFLRD